MPVESADPPAVFVGNVDSNGDSKDLHSLFSAYGTVNSIDVKKGFAFVFMPDRKEAESAIAGVNGTPFGPASRELRVEWSRGNGVIKRREHERRNARPNNTLFVANFTPSDDAKPVLTKLFEEFGDLVRVDVMNHYAFVQYTDVRHATAALEAMQGKLVNDRALNVEYSVRDGSSRTMRGSGPRHGGPPASYYGHHGGNFRHHPGGPPHMGYGNHAGGAYPGPGAYGHPPPYGAQQHYGAPPPYASGYPAGGAYAPSYGNGYGPPPGRGGYGGYGGYGGGYGGGPQRHHRRRDDGAGWANSVDERRKRPLSPRRSLSPRRGEGDLPRRRSTSGSPTRNGKRARRRSRSHSRSRSRSRSPSPAVAKKRAREDRSPSRSPEPAADKKRSRLSRSQSRSRSRSRSPPPPAAHDGSKAEDVKAEAVKAEEDTHGNTELGHSPARSPARSPRRADASRSPSRSRSASPRRDESPRTRSPQRARSRSSSPGARARNRDSSPDGSEASSSSGSGSPRSASPRSPRSSSPPPAAHKREDQEHRGSDAGSPRSASPQH